MNPYSIDDSVYEVAIQEKDNKGGAGKSVLNWGKAKRSLDFKTDFFKAELGKQYLIDILPFLITNALHPLVAKGTLAVGKPTYFLDLFVHKNIGLNQSAVVCPKENYGKPCPLCAEYERLKKEGYATNDKATIEASRKYKPSKRTYMNLRQIVDGVAGEPMVAEFSYARFTKELLEEAKLNPVNGRPIPFADPERGYSIRFRTAKPDSGFPNDVEFKNFNFVQRRESIPLEVMQKTVDFSDLIITHTAQEITALMYGESAQEPKFEEQEYQPEVKETPKFSTGCPAGMSFGVDFENDKACDACCDSDIKVWKACRKAKVDADNVPY